MQNAIFRGEIYLTNFSGNVGSEQGGIRPAIIVQNKVGNIYSPTTIAVPLTSKIQKRGLPTHFMLNAGEIGLIEDSVALCEQIQTVDKSRLLKRLGAIENQEMLRQLNLKLMIAIGLNEGGV